MTKKTRSKKRAPREPKKTKRVVAKKTKRRAPKKTKSTPSTKRTKKTRSTPKKGTRRETKPTKTKRRPARRRARTRAQVKAPPAPPPPSPPRLPTEPLVRGDGPPVTGGYPETRLFPTAASLLGYLEGRPGVRGLLTAFPVRAGEVAAPRDPARREAWRERLQGVPLVADAQADEGEEREPDDYGADDAAQLVEDLLDVLEWCDDGGAMVEADVESDSLGEDG